MKKEIYKIGLKANAAFLFELTNGNNLGGTSGGVEHVSVIHLNTNQFNDFKQLILKNGYNVKESLKKCIGCTYDYSCYLKR